MLFLTLALAALALVGHAAFWVGVVNRWHGTGYPRAVVKTLTLIPYSFLLGIPLWAAWTVWQSWPSWPAAWQTLVSVPSAYAAFCLTCSAVHLPIWVWGRWRQQLLPTGVRRDHHQVVNIEQQLGYAPAGDTRTQLFCRIPGNQIWDLNVSSFNVDLPAMAEALDGTTICHISDLHFSGRIERAYFEEVVRLCNEQPPDILALTGDICDKARYIDWITDTLAAAEARLGKFFVLGNHDLRTHDVPRLRSVLEAAGFTDLSATPAVTADGQIILAGNERPWFKSPLGKIEPQQDWNARGLRILLSHSPDQLPWARQQGFDLMLAGHTHGGQIRFPLIGPVICPSRHGIHLACGFFRKSPTMLHVSRGTAGLMPLRINCPPEITRLVLRASNTRSSKGQLQAASRALSES